MAPISKRRYRGFDLDTQREDQDGFAALETQAPGAKRLQGGKRRRVEQPGLRQVSRGGRQGGQRGGQRGGRGGRAPAVFQACYNAMVDRGQDEPGFKITFKVMLSSHTAYKTSLSFEGNDEVKRILIQEMPRCPYMHPRYWSDMYETSRRCIAFLDAVRRAANEPPPETQIPFNKVITMTDEEFDLWLTIEMDHRLQMQTWIEVKGGSQNMKRVLDEGSVAYDMEHLWEPMKNAMRYLFAHGLCLISVPRPPLRALQAAGSPNINGRGGRNG